MAMEGIAFGTPKAEEMTKAAIGIGGAVVTGLAEGVIIKMAPGLGALQPILTWGTLLGVPLLGVAGALFMRGMIGDLFMGVASGGSAILGYSLPALVAPFMPATKGQAGAQQQLSGQRSVKQLSAGPASAPQRAQAQAQEALRGLGYDITNDELYT